MFSPARLCASDHCFACLRHWRRHRRCCSQRDHACTGERGDVDQVRRSQLPRILQAVGENRRPSASVLMTSIVLPDIAICTSPGFCALPAGMFSVARTMPMTFTLGLSSAIARMAPIIAAPPAMSYFIFSMPSLGLIEMPPVSKVTPLPTNPSTGFGGATMIGVMRAIALLKPKVKVIGIVCATENMPSGKAQKPGDVQIAMSGKSIEIINTDAEGRLVLANGLYYARQLGCTHLVDAATLTGAVVVALGYNNAGIFANDDDIYNRFHAANAKAGEKMWRMPLDDEYKEQIRSSIADIVNSGGRWGGAITAAMFLKEFAEDTPWIHLDIAGTAWMEDQKPWIAKGPSGIALRSLA